MMKKLSAFIVAFTLFFSAAPLALAIVPGSFTVSNYAYDPSTKHLTFDISNLILCLSPISDIVL